MPELECHEVAGMFPLMNGTGFKELADSIEEQGLQLPIELYQGKILDGRNRYRACLDRDIEPDLIDVEPDDPVAYVLAMNLHRRHLNESQRGMVAARAKEIYKAKAKKRKEATLKKGSKKPDVANLPHRQDQGKARDQAGAAVGVSGKTVDHAAKVLDKGAAVLVDAVDKGEVAVSTAAKLAELPKAEQTKAVKGGKKAINQVLKPPPPKKDKPKFPATEQLMEWLSLVAGGIQTIKQDYGSLEKMVKGKMFNRKDIPEAAAFFKAVTDGITRLNKEMEKLCPKQ